MHIEKYYTIIYRSEYDPHWRQLQDTEYTEKEANAEVRGLNSQSKRLGGSYKFRKRYAYSAVVETLTARRNG